MNPAKKTGESFSSVDAAWLHMDTPTNLASITGVITFKDPIEFEQLRQLIELRLLPYDRFKQVVREPERLAALPRWEFDLEFDWEYHLQKATLSEPGDERALQALAGELMSVPLDRAHPLWQFHFIEDFDGGSALVARLHHCIADGVALIRVLLSMTAEDPQASLPGGVSVPPMAEETEDWLASDRRATGVVSQAARVVEYVVEEGLETLARPWRIVSAARLGVASLRALAKLLLILPDKKTLFKQPCGIAKQVTWSAPISLAEVKAVGGLMGGTVNDVLLSAMTGALRRYLEEHGEPVAGLDIRTLIPVDLRPPEQLGKLGNQFGLVFLSLPVGVKDPIRRQLALKRRMDEIKNSPEAIVAIGILSVIGMTPVQIEKIITTIFGWKGTAVMTNVPGPRQTRYLAGSAIKTLMCWVPTPANLTLGVSIISYAGEVFVGVATDAGVIPDPENIVAAFLDEFQYMSRWGRPRNKLAG